MRRHTVLGAMLIALTAVLFGSIRPPVASAHGGLIAVRVTAGPYQVSAVVSRADKLVDEAIRVQIAGSKETVNTAVVTVSLKDAEGGIVGVYPARLSGGIYEVRYPPAKGDGWRVMISILGPRGTETVEHTYKAPALGWVVGSGLTGLILNVVSALVVLVGMPVLAYWLWFRQPPAAGATRAGNTPEQPAAG